jgi:ubiquinone/menaquinone biosynthesis C-methylase UbiE
MARARKVNPDGYVHARDAKEYQRLRDQARMWQGATAEVLAAVGLGPGMSCLDVGSGPGAVLRLMADRVGPQGRVTGIEIDAALGAMALQELRREGGAQFQQITADLLTLETPPGAPFDLTFCRLLLMHMRDPVTILEKMAAWTSPGGIVVAQEFDFGAIAVEPTCPAVGEFNRVFEGVFRGPGRNLRAGCHYFPLSQMANVLIGIYDGLYAAGAELGLADPMRASKFRKEMAEAGADGRYYCLTPVLIAAWKRMG